MNNILVQHHNQHLLDDMKRTESASELNLKEILLLQRQRLEQSKQNFFLSSAPSSHAPSPIPTTVTSEMTTSTLAAVADAIEKRLDTTKLMTDDKTESTNREDEELKKESKACDAAELETNDDSALHTHTNSESIPKKCKKSKTAKKSLSASSSLHLLYTNIVRKIPYGRRKHLSSNTDDEEEDVGVCDVSGGDISDDYDNCDVVLRKRKTDAENTQTVREKVQSGAGSKGDFKDELASHEGFYETSDTGGELTTTDDIDSSMNLISNLSYNSSNSNTSIENRSSLDKSKNAHSTKSAPDATRPKKIGGDAQQPFVETTATSVQPSNPSSTKTKTITQKTGAISKARKPVLCPPQQHRPGASVSSPNSSDCSSAYHILLPSTSDKPCSSQRVLASPVGRSKSFQEPGVKTNLPGQRHKKYARFFQRRRSKRSKAGKPDNKNAHSNYSLDTMYQNIEITIQDEEGNFQPYDDNYDTQKNKRRVDLSDADDDEEDDDDKEVLQEYANLMDNRLKPHHHKMYGGVVGSHSDDAGGDISDAASSNSRVRLTENQHVFGKLLRRMRRLSLGWRKPRCHKRRGDLSNNLKTLTKVYSKNNRN